MIAQRKATITASKEPARQQLQPPRMRQVDAVAPWQHEVNVSGSALVTAARMIEAAGTLTATVPTYPYHPPPPHAAAADSGSGVHQEQQHAAKQLPVQLTGVEHVPGRSSVSSSSGNGSYSTEQQSRGAELHEADAQAQQHCHNGGSSTSSACEVSEDLEQYGVQDSKHAAVTAAEQKHVGVKAAAQQGPPQQQPVQQSPPAAAGAKDASSAHSSDRQPAGPGAASAQDVTKGRALEHKTEQQSKQASQSDWCNSAEELPELIVLSSSSGSSQGSSRRNARQQARASKQADAVAANAALPAVRLWRPPQQTVAESPTPAAAAPATADLPTTAAAGVRLLRSQQNPPEQPQRLLRLPLATESPASVFVGVSAGAAAGGHFRSTARQQAGSGSHGILSPDLSSVLGLDSSTTLTTLTTISTTGDATSSSSSGDGTINGGISGVSISRSVGFAGLESPGATLDSSRQVLAAAAVSYRGMLAGETYSRGEHRVATAAASSYTAAGGHGSGSDTSTSNTTSSSSSSSSTSSEICNNSAVAGVVNRQNAADDSASYAMQQAVLVERQVAEGADSGVNAGAYSGASVSHSSVTGSRFDDINSVTTSFDSHQ